MRKANILVLLAALLVPSAAAAQITPYAQDFEALNPADISALDADGWLVFGAVFDSAGTTFLYQYGPFPAPNDGAAFCAIATGEGGVEQGSNQLSVFSDYENLDHANNRVIESIVYREWNITAANVGEVWEFFFESKLGNLVNPPSSAQAFIKTIDPNTGFSTTNLVSEDMTNTPATWTGYSLVLDIVPALEGQLFQIGFSTLSRDYASSGIFYDNVDVRIQDLTPAPSPFGLTLSQNVPNPFNPTTVIRFALDRPGPVELAVYDAAGRRVATLGQPGYEAGQHQVWWDGRSDSGAAVASGRYSYVLRTPDGELSRSMLLLK